jgi:peptidyl-prolyl cis-trans isomerase C
VVRVFGNSFENALRTLPVGGWQGPVRSGFGLHLVELSARESGRKATLDEVRAAVERDLLYARTEEASTAFYNKVRANYSVRIDAVDAAAAEPAG